MVLFVWSTTMLISNSEANGKIRRIARTNPNRTRIKRKKMAYQKKKVEQWQTVYDRRRWHTMNGLGVGMLAMGVKAVRQHVAWHGWCEWVGGWDWKRSISILIDDWHWMNLIWNWTAEWIQNKIQIDSIQIDEIVVGVAIIIAIVIIIIVIVIIIAFIVLQIISFEMLWEMEEQWGRQCMMATKKKTHTHTQNAKEGNVKKRNEANYNETATGEPNGIKMCRCIDNRKVIYDRSYCRLHCIESVEYFNVDGSSVYLLITNVCHFMILEM